jgi:hypothetical protein
MCCLRFDQPSNRQPRFEVLPLSEDYNNYIKGDEIGWKSQPGAGQDHDETHRWTDY